MSHITKSIIYFSEFNCTVISGAISALQEWNTQYTYNCMNQQYESNKINRRLRNIENKIFKHQDKFVKINWTNFWKYFCFEFWRTQFSEGGMNDVRIQRRRIHLLKKNILPIKSRVQEALLKFKNQSNLKWIWDKMTWMFYMMRENLILVIS